MQTLRLSSARRPSINARHHPSSRSTQRHGVISRAAPARNYTLSSVDNSFKGADLPLTADGNYTYLATNMGETVRSAVSGYAGRWSRYQGPNLDQLLAEGDIIYGFR